jgi:hypothetical protein
LLIAFKTSLLLIYINALISLDVQYGLGSNQI